MKEKHHMSTLHNFGQWRNQTRWLSTRTTWLTLVNMLLLTNTRQWVTVYLVYIQVMENKVCTKTAKLDNKTAKLDNKTANLDNGGC